MLIARISCLTFILLWTLGVHSQTVLFMDDFEARDFSAWSGTNQATPDVANATCPQCGAIVTTPAHSGQYSFEATMSSAGAVKLSESITPVSDVYARFYFYLDKSWSQPSNGSVAILTLGGEQIRFYNSSDGLHVRDSGGRQGTSVLTREAWHSIEVHSYTANGSGTVTVWLDGNVEINATGPNVGGTISTFYLGVDNFGSSTGTIYFDDVVVSTSPIGSPAANITVRYPNTAARLAIPVDVVMFGELPSDVLVASIDGSPVYTKRGYVEPHERFPLRLQSLNVGDHTFQIALTNSNGAQKASYSSTIHKYVAGTPTVSIDEDNNIVVAGHKYFAIAPFADGLDKWQPWASAKAANTYGWVAGYVNSYAYNAAEYKGFLNSLNGALAIGPDDNFQGRSANAYAANQPDAAAVVSGYVSSLNSHPSVFMWTWKDEPDIGPGLGHVPVTQMRSLLQATHANDGNHPVILNLAGYPNSNVRNRRAGWHYPIVPGSAELPADVYSFDMYPFIYQTGGYTVAQWVDQIDRVNRYTYGLTPWFVFVEGGIQPCNDPPVCTNGYGPNAAQVRMEAWLAVIHGVRGISWWGPLAYSDLAHQQSMAKFMSEISSLKDAVMSSTTRTVTSDQTAAHARVDAMVRESNGKAYIFAARLSDVGEDNDPSITANLTVSGFGSPVATVYGESRTVSVVKGVITDVFAPSSVHIYEISAPAAPSNLTGVVK